MIVDVPADTPVTIPVTDPTVAIPDDPELHVPPAIVLSSVVVSPTHTLMVPVIAGGEVFTVTVFVMMQKLLNV